MREAAEELEEEMVDVRREDKTIKPFKIPMQEDIAGVVLQINSLSVLIDHEPVIKNVDVTLRR